MLNIDDLKAKIEELSRDLDRKQKEYNSLFEEMNAGFAFHKILLNKSGTPKDYVYLKLNKEYERQTGLKSDDILGRTGLEVFPNLEKKTIRIYGDVALGKGPEKIELYVPDIDKYFDVNVYSPFKNFFVTTFYDISKRKKADILIAESEWKYRSVFENIREGMVFNEIIRDSQGNVIDYKILDVNKSYEIISGKKRSELIGSLATDIFEMSSGEIALAWKKHHEYKKHEAIEHLDEKSGKVYKVSINRLQKDKFVTIYSDITELIESRNRAEESDQLKSSFLANMSHEIRTPMNGILGYTEIISMEDDPEKRYNYLEIIKKSGHQLLSIVNDIIDISKIESGNVELHLGKTNLNHIFENIRSGFHSEVSSKGLDFTIHNDIPGSEEFITDELKLVQILNNLIKNAVKFTDTGSISISAKLQIPDKYLFEVKDTGIGIHPKYHKLIFERFRKAELDSNILRGGNGLGLAICRAFLDKMDGEIWVNSSPGKGSRFMFTLPYHSKSIRQSSRKAGNPTKLND